jgi:hypothetical protein
MDSEKATLIFFMTIFVPKQSEFNPTELLQFVLDKAFQPHWMTRLKYLGFRPYKFCARVGCYSTEESQHEGIRLGVACKEPQSLRNFCETLEIHLQDKIKGAHVKLHERLQPRETWVSFARRQMDIIGNGWENDRWWYPVTIVVFSE